MDKMVEEPYVHKYFYLERNEICIGSSSILSLSLSRTRKDISRLTIHLFVTLYIEVAFESRAFK